MTRLFTTLLLISFLLPIGSIVSPMKKNQGVQGKITWLEGNQMPVISDQASEPEKVKGVGVVRRIQIYPIVNLADTRMVDGLFQSLAVEPVAETTSNEKGEYKINLPPGNYSIFTVEEDGLFANSFHQDGSIQPFTVKKRKWTKLDIVINYKAVY